MNKVFSYAMYPQKTSAFSLFVDFKRYVECLTILQAATDPTFEHAICTPKVHRNITKNMTSASGDNIASFSLATASAESLQF